MKTAQTLYQRNIAYKVRSVSTYILILVRYRTLSKLGLYENIQVDNVRV